MTKPIITIHDLETNEITSRQMNNEEYAQHQKDVAAEEAKKIADEQARAAKLALLQKLGITEDEAKLLLS